MNGKNPRFLEPASPFPQQGSNPIAENVNIWPEPVPGPSRIECPIDEGLDPIVQAGGYQLANQQPGVSGTPVDSIVGDQSEFPIDASATPSTEKADKIPHMVFGKQ